MKPDWRKVIVYGSVMGFDGCALYALITLLNVSTADSRLSILRLMLVYPLAFFLNGTARRLRPRLLLYPVNLVAWALVTLLLVKTQLYGEAGLTDPAWLLAIPQALGGILYGFRPELLVLLSSAALWWAGWHLSRTGASFAGTLTDFQFSLIILLTVFFIATGFDTHVSGGIPLAVAFFVLALIGISVAHAREGGASWLSGLRNGHWPGLLLGAIALIIVLGLAISIIVTPDLIQLILAAIAWAWEQVIKAMIFVMSLFPDPGPVELPPGMNATSGEPKEGGIPFAIPEPWLSALRLSWSVLFAGLVILALWRISAQLYSWLRRRTTSPGAETEKLPGGLTADLIGWLKHLLARIFHLFRASKTRQPVDPPELASVRQVYRQLLKWAAQAGWRRPAGITPYEYLSTLEKLLPSAAGDFRLITKQYVCARYGQSSPTADELTHLKQSWQQIARYRPVPAKTKSGV